MEGGRGMDSNNISPRDKLNDTEFVTELKRKLKELNETPGLREKLLEINNIQDGEKRKQALNEIPGIKDKIKEIMDMIGMGQN